MMDYAALFVLFAFAFALLPGTAFHGKPRVDWGSPHAYVALARELTTLAIAIAILT